MIPGSGRSTGEEIGYPLQDSGLGNSRKQEWQNQTSILGTSLGVLCGGGLKGAAWRPQPAHGPRQPWSRRQGQQEQRPQGGRELWAPSVLALGGRASGKVGAGCPEEGWWVASDP